MNYLSYKTFVWPHNPHTYRETCSRETKFRTKDGTTTFEGMGPMRRTVRGSGVFFGENAYERFRALAELFEDGEPGNLEHPVWGIRYCYFTGLELTQEPREDYVSYTFEFTCALTNGQVPV